MDVILYYIPLLFQVLERNDLFGSGGYIAVYGLTEEWVILWLLYRIP